MKLAAVLGFALLLLTFGVAAPEANDLYGTASEDQVPPGYERRKIEDSYYILPQGSRVTRKNNVLIVESARNYAARKIQELEDRMAGLSGKQEEIGKQLEELRTMIADIRQGLASEPPGSRR